MQDILPVVHIEHNTQIKKTEYKDQHTELKLNLTGQLVLILIF
jgi:hypothetical protein